MASHDTFGKPYAKLADLKAGDVLELDQGFTCMKGERNVCLYHATNELFVHCNHGLHFLSGQDDGDGYLVGMYKR